MVQLAFGRACGGSVAQRCGVGGRACGGSVAQRCGIRIARWLVIAQLDIHLCEKIFPETATAHLLLRHCWLAIVRRNHVFEQLRDEGTHVRVVNPELLIR